MAELKQYTSVVAEEVAPSPLASPAMAPNTNKSFGSFSLETRKKHLSDIYWVSPAKMVFFLMLGILMSVLHHVYYQSRVGKVVGNESDQQNEHRIGNLFAFVVQSSLAMSIGFSYIQVLWMTLKVKDVRVGTLNSAFSALHSILFIFNEEMVRKIKLASLIALTAWSMPIPSLFTPATLFVNPTSITLPSQGLVRVLDISNYLYANYYEYSTPASGPNVTGAAISSQMFLGPRTILERLSVATASTGEILEITPPYVNSSYQIQFWGPIVQCQKANSTQQAIIENLIAQDMQTKGNITQLMNAYYAYVPNLSTPDQAGIMIDRLQQPSNGSNQLWLSFRRNGTGFISEPVPTCPIIEYRVCQLYNASYSLNMSFSEGNQTITGYTTNLTEVDFPVLNLTAPSDRPQEAYSAYMWAFTNQLVGSIGFYNDTSTNKTTPAEYLEIKTSIESTSILGSSDLDCAFGANSIIPDIPGTPTYQTQFSPQRQQDIDLARNRTLDELIPELSFNTTLSLMNDPLLAPLQNATIYKMESLNLWGYHKANLWAAYGISIFIAVIVNLIGAYAYMVNKVAHDISFSSLVSSTTDDTIVNAFKKEDPETRGKLPLPTSIEDEKITFTPLDEGGHGFQTVERVEERRRSSAGVTSPLLSPQIGAMTQQLRSGDATKRLSRIRMQIGNSVSSTPFAPVPMSVNEPLAISGGT